MAVRLAMEGRRERKREEERREMGRIKSQARGVDVALGNGIVSMHFKAEGGGGELRKQWKEMIEGVE
jgi:hypothetical protein